MIWCNKDKYNFISKLLKTNANKEVQYLKNLIEREELDKEIKELVSEFFLINNNFDLQEFVQRQSFFDFDFPDEMLTDDFIENKDKVAYAIVEAILSQK
jgi:malonyl CoA-acyl carrier protein transacylase